MSDSLTAASDIAISAMKAQTTRLKTISENIANAESVGATPGEDPYARRVVSFKSVLDQETGANLVKVDEIVQDESEFGMKYEPNHPAANKDGYVKTPNVNPLIEMMDLKEAQRSYEANLNVVKMSRDMKAQTLDLLK